MIYGDWDKIPPEKIFSLLSMGIKAFKEIYAWVRKHKGKKQADAFLSSIFRELLKETPDLDMVKAKLLSFRPANVEHTLNVQRAKSILQKVEMHQKMAAGAATGKTGIKTKRARRPAKEKAMRVKIVATKASKSRALKKS
jgi:PleD family two-component response regulator